MVTAETIKNRNSQNWYTAHNSMHDTVFLLTMCTLMATSSGLETISLSRCASKQADRKQQVLKVVWMNSKVLIQGNTKFHFTVEGNHSKEVESNNSSKQQEIPVNH